MPIFDPTQLGPQGRVFDGHNVRVKVGSQDAPDNCLKGIGPQLTVEGKEHQHALGKRRAFAMTAGVVKPGESTLMVFASHLDAFLSCWSPSGTYLDIPQDVTITLDEKSSPGLAALASVLKLGTKTISMLGCEITGIGGTFETGGGALITEVKCLPLHIEWMGFAGTAK